MEQNVIDYYVQNILKKQLRKLKISNSGVYEITANIKEQLCSIIKHWNDIDFKNALFITSREEGDFYLPTTNNQIGNLVVLGIRNSLIETIASIECGTYGLRKPIEDKQTIEITTSAINYFKEIDLEKLATTIDIEEDYYKNITEKYPVAWNALIELGKCNEEKLEREYSKINFEKFIIEEINRDFKEIKNTNFENGITEEINDSLAYFLKAIEEGKSTLLYVDSFKFLSRNFDKNLRILEFILTHNGKFITNNYYLKNDYVSRRKDIIRAGHKEEFNEEALATIAEVSNKYGNKILDELFIKEETK